MNDKLIIDGNVSAHIKSIKQRLTYDLLWAGLPTKEFNAKILTSVIKEAKGFCYLTEVHLIEPEQKPIKVIGTYSLGEPARLPEVICIVELRSFNYRDTNGASALGLIWFQDTFMFPIAPQILKKIRAVPFRQLCQQYKY